MSFAGYNHKKHTDWIWVIAQIPCSTDKQKLSVTNLKLRKFNLLADVKSISQDREWEQDLAQTEGEALELWPLSAPWGCETNSFWHCNWKVNLQKGVISRSEWN